MTTDFTNIPVLPPNVPSWRLLEPSDMPSVYFVVTKVDPRWWRFSRHGLDPVRALESASSTAAGVIVLDGFNAPVAVALLADSGSSGTAMIEYFALPDAASEALARQFAPELVAAAFAGASIRQLYYERFENDADVLGEVGKLFEVEVTYPSFAMIDGNYEARTTAVLSSRKFADWKEAMAE